MADGGRRGAARATPEHVIDTGPTVTATFKDGPLEGGGVGARGSRRRRAQDIDLLGLRLALKETRAAGQAGKHQRKRS